MKILVEQIKPGGSPNASRPYYTFWVRVMDMRTGGWFTSGGWRYFPDTRVIGSPSISKGNGSYVASVKYDALVRAEIQRQIEEFFEVAAVDIPEAA